MGVGSGDGGADGQAAGPSLEGRRGVGQPGPDAMMMMEFNNEAKLALPRIGPSQRVACSAREISSRAYFTSLYKNLSVQTSNK